jgi:integrase
MSITHPIPRRRQPSGSVVTEQKKRGGPKLFLKTRDAHGRQRKKLLGPLYEGRGPVPEGHWTRRQAEARLREVLVDMGRDDDGPGSNVTLGSAVRAFLRYLQAERERSPSTVRDYRNALRSRVLPFLGEGSPVAAIGPDDLDALRGHLLGQVSRRTAQKHMVIVHGLLAYAVRRRWAPSNPAAAIEKVTVARRVEFAVLSPAEVFEVARHASESIGVIIILAAFTGLRMGELRGLRWRDIDFTGRLIHVRRNLPHGAKRERVPKGRQARSVPLLDQAVPVLDNLSRRERFTGPGDLVFPGPTGEHLDDRPIRNGLYAAMAAAEIDRDRGTGKPFVFHDLRHSFGTLAVRIFPITDVQDYMGHADIATTRLYVHHVPKHDAADRLSALVAADLAPLPTAA